MFNARTRSQRSSIFFLNYYKLLNLRIVFSLAKISNKKVPSLSSASFFKMDSAQESDLTPFFGDLSQSKKALLRLSHI